MSKLIFCYFMDYEDGRMARFETTGNYEIPLNIFIDNASEMASAKEGPCSIDICGVGNGVRVFASEEEYLEAKTNFALESMVPIGTFPADPDDEHFEESPHILFTGKVIDVRQDPDAEADGPNYCVLVETLELSFYLYIRHDAPIEKGFIVHGVAWLFGDLEMEDDPYSKDSMDAE